MASKLMGLRDDLDQLIETEAAKVLTKDQFMEFPGFDELMGKIIAASHAEGVAEGAELEKADIRKASMHYGDGEEIEGSDAETVEGGAAVAQYEMYILPASVLVPTKEGK